MPRFASGLVVASLLVVGASRAVAGPPLAAWKVACRAGASADLCVELADGGGGPNFDDVADAKRLARVYRRVGDFRRAARAWEVYVDLKEAQRLGQHVVRRGGPDSPRRDDIGDLDDALRQSPPGIDVSSEQTEGDGREERRPSIGDALVRAGVLRRTVSDYGLAANHFRRAVRWFRTHGESRTGGERAMFEVAETLRRAGRDRAAYAQYRTYLEIWSDREAPASTEVEEGAHVAADYWNRRLRARLHAGRIDWRRGRHGRAHGAFRAVRESFAGIPKGLEDRTRGARRAAAQAAFMIGEYHRHRMSILDVTDIPSDDPKAERDARRERFRKLFRRAVRASRAYTDVLPLRVDRWSVAALVQLPRVLEEVTRILRMTPLPDGLAFIEPPVRDADLESASRDAVPLDYSAFRRSRLAPDPITFDDVSEVRAQAIEEQAIGEFDRALSYAERVGVENRYTRLARRRLRHYRGVETEPPSEMVASPDHVGDGFTRSPFLTSADTDE